jgi:hypothetical protein
MMKQQYQTKSFGIHRKQPDHLTAQFFTNQPTLAIETLTKFGLIRDLTAG